MLSADAIRKRDEKIDQSGRCGGGGVRVGRGERIRAHGGHELQRTRGMRPHHLREAGHGPKDRPRLDHEVRHDEGLSAPGVLRRRQWRPGAHRHDGREPYRGRGAADLRHERRLLLHRVEHGLLHRHDDHEQPHGLPRLQQREPRHALLLHGNGGPPVRARQARAHGRQDVRLRRPRLRPRDGRRTQDPQRRAHELVQLPREGGADQSRQQSTRHTTPWARWRGRSATTRAARSTRA